jgi:hypothetical protein
MSYNVVVSLPLESILSETSIYEADLSDSVVSFILNSLVYINGHYCENYDFWLIEHHRYIWTYGWRIRLVFLLLSCNIFFLTNSASYEYIRESLPIKEHSSYHGNANGLLEDLVAKDYILDIFYKKPKHTLNVWFRVLVWAIRVISHKICILFPNH